MLLRSAIIRASELSFVKRMVRRSRLFRGVVKRFIAGDTLEESLAVAETLAASGYLVTLDNLGENTKSEAEALLAKNTYIEMLRRIARSPQADRINISIKLTQCGLDQGVAFAERNYREVLAAAEEVGNFVRVDMEASAYTQRTLDIVYRAFEDHRNTGTVLQSYLFRTTDDVEEAVRAGIRIRLVKGAYLEPESVAYKDKADTDRAYVAQSKRLMESGNYPAIATHDERIIDSLRAFEKEKGLDRASFEFQMLFGIRRDLQQSLKDAGYRVRVYVPYGDSWYPYFSRRLAERPANLFFILKSLFRG
ncbi:MAG: proline dehydrogenase family protein [Fimbriimonadaceae bacterium]|nr:proline dehydrogenase family protein [Fimbriimonadaceae bacterium]